MYNYIYYFIYQFRLCCREKTSTWGPLYKSIFLYIKKKHLEFGMPRARKHPSSAIQHFVGWICLLLKVNHFLRTEDQLGIHVSAIEFVHNRKIFGYFLHHCYFSFYISRVRFVFRTGPSITLDRPWEQQDDNLIARAAWSLWFVYLLNHEAFIWSISSN